MKTAGPESGDKTQSVRPRKHVWRTICDIVNVLAIAYFVFLVIALLMAPKGSRDPGVFALHFVITAVFGYGAKWLRDRHDKRQEKLAR